MLAMIPMAVLTTIAATPTDAKPAHICWIDSVEIDGAGVRIRFGAGAPVPPAPAGVHAEVGARLFPATSGHDGCSLAVARRGGVLGVAAEAHLFLPQIMTEPDIRREWITAAAPR